MIFDDLKRTHPGGRTFTTGKRSIVPNGSLIDSIDPRWEKAEYEETMYLFDPIPATFRVPPEWTLLEGPPLPSCSYQGKAMWKNETPSPRKR